jgi:hypothetical protein
MNMDYGMVKPLAIMLGKVPCNAPNIMAQDEAIP